MTDFESLEPVEQFIPEEEDNNIFILRPIENRNNDLRFDVERRIIIALFKDKVQKSGFLFKPLNEDRYSMVLERMEVSFLVKDGAIYRVDDVQTAKIASRYIDDERHARQILFDNSPKVRI